MARLPQPVRSIIQVGVFQRGATYQSAPHFLKIKIRAMTFKQQIAEIADGQSVDGRIKLSKSANELIEGYQRAYKLNMGHKISKADVVCKLIAYGQVGLEQEREGHLQLAADRKPEAVRRTSSKPLFFSQSQLTTMSQDKEQERWQARSAARHQAGARPINFYFSQSQLITMSQDKQQDQEHH